MGYGYPYSGKPVEPPEPPKKPVIEQRLCIVCGCKTLIKLCWYLFLRDHEDCDAWACYSCKARTRNTFWYLPEPSIIHDEYGLRDRLCN